MYLVIISEKNYRSIKKYTQKNWNKQICFSHWHYLHSIFLDFKENYKHKLKQNEKSKYIKTQGFKQKIKKMCGNKL